MPDVYNSQTPGPGHYATEVKDNPQCTVSMQSDHKIRIPSSIQRNPLNYVRPLIVNLYYKTPVPAVGTYDTSSPNDIDQVISNPNKYTHKAAFKSKIDRLPDLSVTDKDVQWAHQDVGFLDMNKIEKSLDKVKINMPSSNFSKPFIEVQDGESNLPSLIKELIKKNDVPDKKGTDPNYLRTIAERVDNVKQQAFLVQQSGNYDTHDRFGRQLLPHQQVVEVPGPGDYRKAEEQADKHRYSKNPAALISPIKSTE